MMVLRTWATAAMLAGAAAAVPYFALADGEASPGVARIAVIQGQVTLKRGDSGDEISAVRNAPILAADYLSTGPNSRAEVEFDGLSAVRLDQNTQTRFTQVGSAAREVQIAQGTAALSVLKDSDDGEQIDTPSVTVRPRESGDYRVSVTADGKTYVTVRAGSVNVNTPGGAQTVRAHTTLMAQGNAANPVTSTVKTVAFDAFDTWNADRDATLRTALDADSTDPYVEGMADLPSYGRWTSNATYGQVWVPYQNAGWAPYRDGRWIWEDRYGWTWLSAEPWGWAPYHYGRWFYNSPAGWAWYPPAQSYYQPVWSPGLVSFITFGAGSFGFPFGNIGWIPLAPYEPWNPWWGWNGGGYNTGYGFGYGGTTITNITNIITIYKNAGCQCPTPISAVPVGNWNAGRFEHTLPVAARSITNLSYVRGALPVVPTKNNLRFTNGPPAAGATSPHAFESAEFAGTKALPARIPFDQQRADVAHTLGVTPPSTLASPVRSGLRVTPKPHTRLESTDPWNRLKPQQALKSATAPPSNAWHRFEKERNTVSTPNAPARDPWARFDTERPGYTRGSGAVSPHASQSSATVPAAQQLERTTPQLRQAPHTVPRAEPVAPQPYRLPATIQQPVSPREPVMVRQPVSAPATVRSPQRPPHNA